MADQVSMKHSWLSQKNIVLINSTYSAVFFFKLSWTSVSCCIISNIWKNPFLKPVLSGWSLLFWLFSFLMRSFSVYISVIDHWLVKWLRVETHFYKAFLSKEFLFLFFGAVSSYKLKYFIFFTCLDPHPL